MEGLSLLLVDILDEDLNARAKELRQQFGVDMRTATCDLGAHAPYKTIEEAVGGLDIDVLVCNHMFTPADTPPILDMPYTQSDDRYQCPCLHQSNSPLRS